ncbi:A49-like RNA polymerase I associated factor-domain-containing protein [Apiosordaria backusii]|uniref:A49-like RNA polymerase I associated factor-domain-containing protein n=1 Tax=Apiosordaria backusii TaxID=314023 RepID=A0AA40F0F7_9PEZI|nr:A49-like RNA polymerase I associated factor-domain-containing protein [Apiosordaria backusii]
MGDPSQKKRRRPEDETPKSKKKKVEGASAAAAAETYSITKVHKPQVSPPVVAVTPGFLLRDKRAFDVFEKAAEPTTKRRKSGGIPPAPEMALHSSTHMSVDYTARETEQLLNHYVAIVDPKTKEIEIFSAKKMLVRHKVRSKSALDDSVENRAAQTNYEKRTALGEEFGTRKAKKALKSVADNAIMASADKLGQAEHAMLQNVKEVFANSATKEELQAAVDQVRPVPRGNYDAEHIQDVYVPKEIIGSEVLNAVPVMDWQEAVRNNEAVNVPSRFVAHRIARVATNKEDKERLQVMRYLLWVIIFWVTTGKGKERGTKSIAKRDKLRELLSPAPEVVIENIRRKFSDNGVMRKEHMELLMTHCCVFASIIDNFEVNMNDLREDLKLEQKQLAQYFMEVGARVKQSKAGGNINHIAKLQLPLVFPKIRSAVRR